VWTLRYVGTGWHLITCSSQDNNANPYSTTLGLFVIGSTYAASQASPPLDFGQVGGCAARTVEIKNDGSQTFSLNSLVIGGTNAADYAITAGGGSGQLQPGQGRIGSVRFCPAVTGTRTAALTFAGSLLGGPQAPTTIPLTGTH